jgi:hypothetical protein
MWEQMWEQVREQMREQVRTLGDPAFAWALGVWGVLRCAETCSQPSSPVREKVHTLLGECDPTFAWALGTWGVLWFACSQPQSQLVLLA